MSDTRLVAFLPVSETQAKLVLGAMKGVAAAGGEFSPADREALEAAAQHVLYAGQGLEFTTIEAPTSQALAQAFPTVDFRRYVLQLIAVMAFVDGTVDQRKLALVLEYAASLEIKDDYIRDLAETANGQIDWVRSDMSRNNVKSIQGIDPELDPADAAD